MIAGIKNITSENPIEQVWKYLRFFQHAPSVAERITILHNIQDNKQTANVKKQAIQIGYCIRQAEQYFRAAAQVGNATKPNLLYYGAVNLSQALILLKYDGTYSLDARRKEKKHNHHGLEIVRGKAENAPHDNGIEAFLSEIECSCFIKPDGTAWGHFPLFYRCLVPTVFTGHQEIRDIGKASYLGRDFPQTSADLLPIQSIIDTTLNVFSIIKTLPDMFSVMEELGLRTELCKGTAKFRVTRDYNVPLPDETGDDNPAERERKNRESNYCKTTYQQDFFLDGMSQDKKEYFLNFYREHNPQIVLIADFPTNLHLRLILEQPAGQDFPATYLPDIVEDIRGKNFYVLRPESYIPEPAAFLIILFCFGMLSRYYPDVWVKALDENVEIAEFIDSFLNIAYRKFPNLILDQLTNVKHNIQLQ